MMSVCLVLITLSCLSVHFTLTASSTPFSLAHTLDVSSPAFTSFAPSLLTLSAQDYEETLLAFAQKPLRGWNSYDSFLWQVNETQTRANIDYVSQHLVTKGFLLVTIDYYWYLSLNQSIMYLDQYGGLIPDPERFPSSADSQSFAAIAEYAHSKGLFFGIHTMRGISRAAIDANLPIKGTTYTTKEAGDLSAPCPWSLDPQPAHFFSVNLTSGAGQAYMDYLYGEYAAWGVDFIKNDCVYGNYAIDQIMSLSKAIDKSGRKMLISLSPGPGNPIQANEVHPYVSMYRTANDLWDDWLLLKTNIVTAPTMERFIGQPNGRYGAPSFPDLDMLPLGTLAFNRANKYTKDEQRTLITFWCIFRSALIFGGDFAVEDSYVVGLITNDDVLNVNGKSINNAVVVANSNISIWRADSATWQADGIAYFSLINLQDQPQTLTVSMAQVRRHQGGNFCQVRDLWAGQDMSSKVSIFSVTLPPHASGVYSASHCALLEKSSSRHASRPL